MNQTRSMDFLGGSFAGVEGGVGQGCRLLKKIRKDSHLAFRGGASSFRNSPYQQD